jgi:hypothetical protein
MNATGKNGAISKLAIRIVVFENAEKEIINKKQPRKYFVT